MDFSTLDGSAFHEVLGRESLRAFVANPRADDPKCPAAMTVRIIYRLAIRQPIVIDMMIKYLSSAGCHVDPYLPT